MSQKNRNGLYVVPPIEDEVGCGPSTETEDPSQESTVAETPTEESNLCVFKSKDDMLDEETFDAVKGVISHLIEKMENKQPVAFVGTMIFEDGDNHDFCTGSIPLTTLIARLELMKAFLVNSLLEADDDFDDDDAS